MSILVYPYRRNKNTGEMDDLKELPISPRNNLFGSECWRTKIWGAKFLEKFNCSFVHLLSNSNLYLEGSELIKLMNELDVLLKNSQRISAELKVDEEAFKFRICNALEAVRIASKYDNGGVAIE